MFPVNEEVEKVFETINKEIGDIDILINNAGVGPFDFVEDIDEKSIHDTIDINLKGDESFSSVHRRIKDK